MRLINEKLSLSLLFLSVFICSEIFSQKNLIDAQLISVEEGLPTRDVFDVVQDNKGFIWLSTRGVVSRYDGERFKNYTSDFLNTLDQNSLHLAVDKLDRIWYCESTGGLSERYSGIIDTQKDSIITFESLTEGLFSTKDVLYIEQSKVRQHEILICTRNGKVYTYTETGFEEVFQVPAELSPALFCESTEDGSYWIMTRTEVFKIKNGAVIGSYTFSKPKIIGRKIIPHPSELIIQTAAQNRYSKYWKLEENTLVPFFPEKDTLANLSIVESEQKDIFYFNIGKDLWIQDYAGKSLFHFEKISARGMFKDKKGIYWFYTSNGLLKVTVKENPFTVLQKGGNIRGIYVDDHWSFIGDYFGNHFKDLRTNQSIELLSMGWTAMSFSKDKNGHIWGASQGTEILELKPGEEKWIVHDIPNLRNPNVIFKNTDTGNLWIGSPNGLFTLDLKTKLFSPIDLPGFSRKIAVRFFYQNESGIWVATSQGLYLLDPKTETVIKRFSDQDGMPNINLNYLYEDTAGIFWLATRTGGLIRWNVEENSFVQFTQEDGLFNNTIYAIYEDDFGNLWLPSDYGLMCFDKKSKDTRVFLPEHGIPHEEFNSHAHFKTADGTLYFGGLGGVVKFHPKDLMRTNNSNVPLMLTGLRVLTKGENNFSDKTGVFQVEKKITLVPNDQVLELDLAMLDYEASDQNQFAYQIKGYQDQWIYTKDSRLSIIKPTYGNFQLNIKGRSGSGTWSEKSLSIPIVVTKPFYLKTWFLVLLGLCLAGLVYVYFNRRVRRLHQGQQRLESEVKKRTAQIEKDKATILAQTESLKNLDRAKTRFFSNITHEFRTPLTLIIGPLEQLISGNVKALDAPKKLSGVVDNARHLLTLINQLLDLSKLENDSMKKEIMHGSLVDCTKALIQRFQSAIIEKELTLDFKLEMENNAIFFDKSKWNKIVYNLISNAEKFTPSGGAIEVCLSEIDLDGVQHIYFSVSDTGIGIEEGNMERIFDRFYQADNSMTRTQAGTGIGLALVKELVEFQNGKITVSSTVGKGTIFTVLLPILENTLKLSSTIPEEEIPAIPIFKVEKTSAKDDLKTQKAEERFQVLIIDDHDGLREYIRTCLDESIYEINEATDGAQGLEQALKTVPDLIITDVMMPKKDGFEVLRAIRSNIITSHIPVILLTAKASLESRLEGLGGGADAYLTKPFSPQELELRVQKLIEIRRNLQKRYSKGTLPPVEEALHEKEDEFITNLRNYIIENLDNTNLNGDVIGKQFFISRAHLHRKLKALTGQSISEYVKVIRLQKSLELLQEKKWRIAEISDKVGFSSLSSFSRAFKEEFGKAPSKI